MRLFKKTNINFLEVRRTFYLISLAVIVIGLVSLVTKGIGYGIDFLGGTELVVRFEKAPSISEIRNALAAKGFAKAEIKVYGDPNTILIRTTEQEVGLEVGSKIKQTLVEHFRNNPISILEEQKIGPKIGAELRRDALYAVIFSLIAMLIYIGFRFKFIYGVGAVLALFHDVIITLGVISLLDGLSPFFDFEIDQNMIAAFLTLVGLSVNDTVVIFDRIRENLKIYKAMPLKEIINKSINDTLSRTIITSGTIFIVLAIIMLFGGEVTRGFAFALTFGIITGTYSSIYIASAVVYEWSLKKSKQ